MSLSRYAAKRDFTRTREPKGRVAPPRRHAGSRFVIQKHAASRLHYDFRLEIDGVLKSWAVPKGIPTEVGDKRLAVQVEDHPVTYGSFEGIIPPGNYGAGTVMLWDTGQFEVLDGEASSAFADGKLSLQLDGNKLKGPWSLVKMRRSQMGSDNAWLLIKTDASMRKISTRADDRSVKSGRTMKQIADESDAVWASNKNEGTRRKPWRPTRKTAQK